ncbi:hypothetical protein [Dyadobacter sp. MSC1_007]|jgi:hypothetical protein|uniref:hypothetical protein n=1 Tax=Dyadobacter sp. MSC1_007 TaxID=2909264 RepID=UPI00203086D1|nr:hypothetical protein [Dyadobacter sp. MSC1_007]
MIDRRYRKEKLLAWERESLVGKWSWVSLARKSTWFGLVLIVLILSIFGLIVPFIPPRYGSQHWSFPTNISDYQNELTTYLKLVPVFVFSVAVYMNLRNALDLYLNTKLVANFEVRGVEDLGAVKLIIMTGFRFFVIRSKEPYFESVAKGQIIKIKRTGTSRLIDYHVRDKAMFQDEQSKSAVNSTLRY